MQSWIAQGKVSVNGKVLTKAGAPVPPDAAVVITADVPKFVCRCSFVAPSKVVGLPSFAGSCGVRLPWHALAST